MKPMTISMDKIEAREIQWLWPQFIPRGKLIILCGDPGLGKSFVTLDIASRVSRGQVWPFQEAEEGQPLKVSPPGRVVLLSAEDDPADTIKPRLEKMGADVERISIIDGMLDNENRVHDFIIGEHSRDLACILEAHPDTVLLVVDPVSAYVGGTDSYNNAQVRSMLKPLSDLAADHNVTVVLVTHMRKSEAAKMLHATMGSLAFTAAARVVMLVSRDPNDPETRLLLTVKSNLANDRKGFSYKIENGVVVWQAEIDGQADEYLASSSGGSKQKQKELFAVKLREEVRQKGQMRPEEVFKLAESFGMSAGVVKRPEFKKLAGVESRKVGDAWVWVPTVESAS